MRCFNLKLKWEDLQAVIATPLILAQILRLKVVGHLEQAVPEAEQEQLVALLEQATLCLNEW